MGSSTHQFHRCIGIQYWYSTYMSTGIYVYKYTSTGIPYQNARAVGNQSTCAQRVSECLPDSSLLTSPPCQCIWGEIQGKTDNPAKIWNESSANPRDSDNGHKALCPLSRHVCTRRSSVRMARKSCLRAMIARFVSGMP